MKLFKAGDVITNENKQSILDSKRLDGVSNALNNVKKELEKCHQEYEDTVIRNHENLNLIEIEHRKKLETLRFETEGLEKRKKEALAPLEEKWKTLADFNEILIKKEEELKKNKAEVEEMKELLENRLTDVNGRLVDMERNIKLQGITQQGIDAQKEQVALQVKNMNRALEESLVKNKQNEEKMKKREAKAELIEKSLDSKEKDLKKIEASFVERETAIKDKYDTLLLAIEEAKKKGITI